MFPYYFWLIAVALVIYLVWVIFLRTIIRLCRRCCAKAVNFAEMDVDVHEDIFETISYPQLKHELSSTTKDIRTFRLLI